jgi:hypothetical protein
VPGWLAVEPQRRERSPRPRAETDRLFVVKLVNREPAEAEKDVGHGELCFGSTTESEALFPLRAGGGHIPLTERDGGEVVQGALETYRSPSSRANARACSQRARPSAFLPRAARAEPSERGCSQSRSPDVCAIAKTSSISARESVVASGLVEQRRFE